jgi:pyroglutamyl-peptidase
VTSLVDEHHPDLIVHMGLETTRTSFGLESGAFRDGYHDIPDEARKVFTRAESKKVWGKSPERLNSDVGINAVVEAWKREVKTLNGKGKGRQFTVEASDDVGNYVCGFAYYVSLERCWKENRHRNVVFLHVPPCESDDDIKRGVQVVTALVKALVENVEWE